jgi:type IV secretory pathway TrbD component
LDQASEERIAMGLILIVLLLALVFARLGFAIHALWIIAVILFVCWIVGFARSRGHARAA